MTFLVRLYALPARYGTRPRDWPWFLRLVLPVLMRHPQFRDVWRRTAVEEQRLEASFQGDALPLEVSSRLARRLNAISAQPQRAATPERPSRSSDDADWPRLWPLGFGAAFASLLLGVSMGVTGWSAPLLGDQEPSLDFSSSYEVSEWLQGDDL